MDGDLKLSDGYSLGSLLARKPAQLVVVADSTALCARESAAFLSTEERHRQVWRTEASLEFRMLLSHFSLPLFVSSIVLISSDFSRALNPLAFIMSGFVGRPRRSITALTPPPVLLSFLSLEVRLARRRCPTAGTLQVVTLGVNLQVDADRRGAVPGRPQRRLPHTRHPWPMLLGSTCGKAGENLLGTCLSDSSCLPPCLPASLPVRPCVCLSRRPCFVCQCILLSVGLYTARVNIQMLPHLKTALASQGSVDQSNHRVHRQFLYMAPVRPMQALRLR